MDSGGGAVTVFACAHQAQMDSFKLMVTRMMLDKLKWVTGGKRGMKVGIKEVAGVTVNFLHV